MNDSMWAFDNLAGRTGNWMWKKRRFFSQPYAGNRFVIYILIKLKSNDDIIFEAHEKFRQYQSHNICQSHFVGYYFDLFSVKLTSDAYRHRVSEL